MWQKLDSKKTIIAVGEMVIDPQVGEYFHLNIRHQNILMFHLNIGHQNIHQEYFHVSHEYSPTEYFHVSPEYLSLIHISEPTRPY